MTLIARYEWVILELLLLGALLWELARIRRAVRRDRAEKAAREANPTP